MNKTLDRFKTVSIAIAIPSAGFWVDDFGACMCELLSACTKFRIGAYKNQIIHTIKLKGSILPNSRLFAVRQAKDLNADYLLFVDTDQTFPRKTLHLLIDRDVDVVAANIATKTMPASPTARNKSDKDPSGWTPVYTDDISTGLERVDRVGTGLMLLSKKAYLSLPPEAFAMPYRPEVQRYQGEDWTMVDALEAAGFKIYIDHDLSKEVGHIGPYNYRHTDVGRKVEVTEADYEELMRKKACG